MQNLDHALRRLADIHAHLARSEYYRGYRPVIVLLTALTGLIGALLQSSLIPAGATPSFVAYWTLIAVVNIGFTAGLILYHYFTAAGGQMRSQTRTVFGQAMPCLMAAALTTAVITRFQPGLISLLPGLWSLFFALGIFATLPYLPRRIGWSGVWYLIAGEILLLLGGTPVPVSPWGMGIAFGVGQALGAILFQTCLPEVKHEPAET